MNVKIPTAFLEITSDEAITLHYSIRAAIEHTIDTHWVMHPDSYLDGEWERIKIMRQLCRISGFEYEGTEVDLKLRLERAVEKYQASQIKNAKNA